MINRKSAVLIIISSCLVISIYYNCHVYKENIKKYITKEVMRREPIYIYKGTEDFLINTPGCYIPNYGKTLVFKESKNYHMTCGERVVFIKRMENDKIVFLINTEMMMKKYSNKKNTYCYYRFASRLNINGKEDTQLSYTKWEPFKNGTNIKLKEEVITVACTISANTKITFSHSFVYKDAYVFVKKLTTKKPITKRKSWNVLMLGMDTMSRARLLSSMPNSSQYLYKHGWLDYKGYQKVGYNTFPNLMAILTGKKLRTIYEECGSGMTKCNDLFIWSRFRKAGYITAYGEDFLNLPDTFSRHKGFQKLPTHHYVRPFFLTGEKQNGNLICAKHKPSAEHLLDYAYEFANIYKNDNFFGMFWLNSYSHNLFNIPTLLDNNMVIFFEQLNKSGIMNNTIVVLLSDHGIRYGDMRIPMESYYEERLPMFFVWIPHEFRKLYEQKYYNLQLNQNRLVTPYDLYVTLTEILNTPSRNASDVESEACPQCTSIFEEKSADRTCADAGVIDTWCSCHDMTKVQYQTKYSSDSIGTEYNISLQLAVNHVQKIANSVKTIDCMACYSLKLDTVLRIHSYKNIGKTHYVIAWQMAPSDVSFEATVVKEGNNFTVLTPVNTISAYNKRGNCVRDPNDRPFCVCKSVKCTGKVTAKAKQSK